MPLRTKCGSSVRSKSNESSESFESDVSILSSVSSLSSVSIFCGGATSISDGIFRWFGGFQCDSGEGPNVLLLVIMLQCNLLSVFKCCLK